MSISQTWVDEVLSMNPFTAVRDSGGSNGQENVEFKRILRTEKFFVDLPDSIMLPKANQRVHVIERMFVENYENIYITWVVRLADGSVQNPYHFIGMHETSIDDRRAPEDGIIGIDGFRIKQSAIDGFRRRAALQVSQYQHKALNRYGKKKKVETQFDGTPSAILQK